MKLTDEELKILVKESNQDLLEDFTYPYSGNELAVARKQKLGSYEKYINTCLQALKMMVENVNSEYVNNNITDLDVNYLVDDQLERLQAAVGYTISSLQAIVKNNGQHLKGAGIQYPSMMQEIEFGKEKVSSSDMKRAGYQQGKEASSASGLTAQERPIIKQLNDLIIKAATEGNIIPGKAGRLIKLLAAELETIINKAK